MVRLQTLDLRIGVRVPASQPLLLQDFHGTSITGVAEQSADQIANFLLQGRIHEAGPVPMPSGRRKKRSSATKIESFEVRAWRSSYPLCTRSGWHNTLVRIGLRAGSRDCHRNVICTKPMSTGIGS